MAEETKTNEQVIQEELGLKKTDVETVIKDQTKTSLMREGVLYLKKIWESLELLAFIAAAAMLIWCGGKIATINWSWSEGTKDLAEVVMVGLAALLFARLGWAVPTGKVKEYVEKTILKK